MAGIGDIRNGIGFLYVTDAANNIKASLKNSPENALRIQADALTSAPLGGEVLAVGSVTVNVGAGTITNVTVDGVGIMGASAATGATTTLLATDLASKINSTTSVPDYTATSVAGVVYIFPLAGTGSTPNGFVVTSSVTAPTTTTDSNMTNGSPVSGIYDASVGRRYYINANYSGTAVEGSLTNAVEITKYLANRGFENSLYSSTVTIASGQATIDRVSNITLVNIDTEGAAATDDLNTVVATGYNDGDIIIFRGVNAARVVTFKDAVDNIFLANADDFSTGGNTRNISLQYKSGVGFVELSRAPNLDLTVANLRAAGIATPIQGVNLTTLGAGGGTINLEPGVDKGYQVYNGTAALAGSYVIQIQAAPGTPYLDGDEMIVDYRSALTVGANSVTIFGIALTTTQGLEGRVILLAKYKLSNTTWYYSILYKANGVDITNKAYVDATFEPVLGNPPADGYVLSSTALGVRSWIPVSANLTSIPVDNTIFVSKNGDDGTAAPERFDLPYETLAAARTAAISLTPSATNRILIKVFTGTYTEQIVLANFVDWDLGDAIVDLQAGAAYTVDDNNVACDSIIYGGFIKRTTAGTLGALRTQNASTNLRLYTDNIHCSNGAAIGVSHEDGTLSIFGNISTDTATVIVQSDNGTLEVRGNIVGVGSSSGVLCTGGTQKFFGDMSHDDPANHCFEATGGTQYLYGNVTGGANFLSGTQYVFGNITSTNAPGSLITTGDANTTINGDISNTTSGNAVASGGTGITIINGNCTNTLGTCIAITKSGAGIFTLNGDATATSGAGITFNGTGTLNANNSIITSVTSSGVTAQSTGIVMLNGCRIVTTGTDQNAVGRSASSPIFILKNCTFIATGTGRSIFSGTALNVKIYGACEGNLDKSVLVTTQVGVLTIDANVV